MTTAAIPPSGEVHSPESDRAFSIEQHGIDVIPESDRHGHPRDLTWVWAAGAMTYTAFVVGAVIATLQLPLWAGFLAVILGNLPFVYVSWLGTAGPQAGTSTIVISRAAFGRRGNALPTLLSWLTLVGWEAVTTVIGTFALIALFAKLGWGASDLRTVIALVIMIALVVLAAIWGHQTIVVLQRAATIFVGIGLLVIMGYGVSHINWSYNGVSTPGTPTIATWLLAWAIVAASSPISFLNYPADYTRYLPKTTSKTAITLYASLGQVVPNTLLMLFGLAVGTTINMVSPISPLEHMLPSWFLVPFLIVLVLGTLTNNVLNTYSSGLNLQALGLKLARYKTVIVDAVLILGASLYAFFVSNFINSFTNFLSLEVMWICPWGGIFTVDYLLRKTYDGEALLTGSGPYKFSSGVNWRAIAAWVLGILASFWTTNATEWASPLSTGPLKGADLSVESGILVAGLAYYFLSRRQYRAVTRQPVTVAAALGDGVSAPHRSADV